MDNKYLFEVITWPDVQILFDIPGFRENSILINDEPLYSEFGDSSYLVRKSWLDNLNNNTNETLS